MPAKLNGWAALSAAAAGAMAMAPSAQAAELHVGVMGHNVCAYYCDNSGKEGGPSIEAQLTSKPLGFMSWVGSPSGYLIGSLNTAGDTSYAGFGFEWDFDISENWSIEPGVGYIVHDGETNNPYAAGTPEAAAFSEDHVLLGSPDLFRLSLAVTRDFAGPWDGQIMFAHISHGQIIGEDRNQGLDQIGIRIGYHFGE